MSEEEERCEWRIRWGTSPESVSWCRKDQHVSGVTIDQRPDGRFSVTVDGDPEHEGPGLAEFPYQKITWQAGDRREWPGPYPGKCPMQPCTLHVGHHGRHAP